MRDALDYRADRNTVYDCGHGMECFQILSSVRLANLNAAPLAVKKGLKRRCDPTMVGSRCGLRIQIFCSGLLLGNKRFNCFRALHLDNSCN